MGVAVPAVLLALFGLSPSFEWALANRVVEGLSNSNLAVVKAYLSDVVESQHRGLAFGFDFAFWVPCVAQGVTVAVGGVAVGGCRYIGSCFAVARVISASAAGALADVFPKGSWLRFAFPCFMLSPPLVIVFFVAWFYLPESAPSVVQPSVRNDASENAVMLGQGRQVDVVRVDSFVSEGSLETSPRASFEITTASPAAIVAPDLPPTTAGDASCASSVDSRTASGDVSLPPLSMRQGLAVVFSDRPTALVMFVFCVNNFCNGGVLVGNMLVMALPVPHLGLGMSPTAIGLANSVFAIVALTFQVWLLCAWSSIC